VRCRAGASRERDARCRQLDREWEPVQPAADLGHRLCRPEPGSDRARALDEQHFGVVLGQRLDRVALLRFEMQRLATRDDDLRVRRRRQQRRDRRRGLDDLFEIVEHHEQPLVAYVLDEDVVGADRRRDRPLDEGGVAQRLQRRPVDAVGEVLDRLRRQLQRQARLAAAARAGKGEEAVPAQKRARLGELALAADERGRLDREIRPVQRPRRREGRVAELMEALRRA
jgi:hypothetical protein